MRGTEEEEGGIIAQALDDVNDEKRDAIGRDPPGESAMLFRYVFSPAWPSLSEA
jgi:hypothetical protein